MVLRLGGQSPWTMANLGFQYAFQFDEGFFVKDQVVEVTHFAVADSQTRFNGSGGKRAVMLDTTETFFLKGGDDRPFLQQASSAVVVVG